MATDGSLQGMESQRMQTAVAYFRTSSATNVGDDKDSLKRQREPGQWTGRSGLWASCWARVSRLRR